MPSTILGAAIVLALIWLAVEAYNRFPRDLIKRSKLIRECRFRSHTLEIVKQCKAVRTITEAYTYKKTKKDIIVARVKCTRCGKELFTESDEGTREMQISDKLKFPELFTEESEG